YMNIIRTKRAGPVVLLAGSAAPTNFIRDYPVVNVYVQAMSLERVFFYGLGQSSSDAGKSVYGQKQTIIGASGALPLFTSGALNRLRASAVVGVNGRFVTVRTNSSESAPSIEQLYSSATAPGLAEQPNFLQTEEGIRIKPSIASGWLRLNYLVDFQQFLANDTSHSSFRRWTVDLRHDVPLYRTVSSTGPRDTNGPDEC